jgi:hypothetical protein
MISTMLQVEAGAPLRPESLGRNLTRVPSREHPETTTPEIGLVSRVAEQLASAQARFLEMGLERRLTLCAPKQRLYPLLR